MRVVGGQWRGRPLVAPAGRGTRPTSDKVREAIFDVLAALPEAGAAPAVTRRTLASWPATSSSTSSPAVAGWASRPSPGVPPVARSWRGSGRRCVRSTPIWSASGSASRRQPGARARCRRTRSLACASSASTRVAPCRLTRSGGRGILSCLWTLRTSGTWSCSRAWRVSWDQCSRRAPCSSSRRPFAHRSICPGGWYVRSATATPRSRSWSQTTCRTQKGQLTMTARRRRPLGRV